MHLGKFARLIISLFVCQLAGIVGSVFTITNIPTWYAFLQKPFFAPPNWLFGPAWITLYFLMGLALFFAWEKKVSKRNEKEKKSGIRLFELQLSLNALWSFLFFGLQSPVLGLIGIVALWLSIAATMISFYKTSRRSFWLMVPYIAWVSFASALNCMVWLLN